MAVVIPCFRVSAHVAAVIASVPLDVVDQIFVVDDKCPEGTGDLVNKLKLEKTTVIYNKQNLGVGGATKVGLDTAFSEGYACCIKIDGDGQMDSGYISGIVALLKQDKFDYIKGNRFFFLGDVESMPRIRLIGNSLLTVLTRVSSGYWAIGDPTNGFVAIRKKVWQILQDRSVANGYFFETHMIIRLGEIRARIAEIPMPAIYENESSNLKISKIVIPFIRQHLKAACRRFMMEYFVRGLSVATVTLPIGLFATVWGVGFTVYLGYQSNYLGIPASSGDIALSILSVLLGVQFSIAAFTEDLAKKSGLVEIVIIAKDN